MTADIQRKACFAHAGTGRQNDEIGPVQACDGGVQFTDAGGDAPVFVLVGGIQLVQAVEGLQQDFPHWLQPPHALPLADIENFLLRRVQQQVGFLRALAGVVQNAAGGLHQGAHVVLVPDNVGVNFHVGNGGNNLRQLGQVHLARGLFKVAVFLQLFQYGDKIHRTAQSKQFLHGPVDQAVVDRVEIVWPGQNLRHDGQTGGFQKDGAQHGLLRLQAERHRHAGRRLGSR